MPPLPAEYDSPEWHAWYEGTWPTRDEDEPHNQPWFPYDHHTASRTAMPWYHTTDVDFSEGDELKPPTELEGGKPSGRWGDDYRPNRVYFTQADEDGDLSESPFGKHTYEVEPIGETERDPEDRRQIYNDWMAPGARIIRKINPKKARTMTAAVTVYTSPSCIQCTMTKKQLDKLGIEHQTVDVTQDPEAHAYVTGLGYTSAPVVVVNDGERHWGGFSPDKLKGLISE